LGAGIVSLDGDDGCSLMAISVEGKGVIWKYAYFLVSIVHH